MDLNLLNRYLAELEGIAEIEKISPEKATLVIKFNGNTGSIDDGEILLEFYGVSSMCLSFTLLSPTQLKLSNGEAQKILDPNYLDSDLNFYQLVDDTGCSWWVYAEGYRTTLLPVFYGP